jgi:hypothetical protein
MNALNVNPISNGLRAIQMLAQNTAPEITSAGRNIQ